eukprot:1157650-Pelagomonas_calceolata.AAC.1
MDAPFLMRLKDAIGVESCLMPANCNGVHQGLLNCWIMICLNVEVLVFLFLSSFLEQCIHGVRTQSVHTSASLQAATQAIVTFAWIRTGINASPGSLCKACLHHDALGVHQVHTLFVQMPTSMQHFSDCKKKWAASWQKAGGGGDGLLSRGAAPLVMDWVAL